jgi:carbon storage regulator
MLVLSRKVGESLVLGSDIEISILENQGGEVKLGIVAPREVVVLRKEIVEEVEVQNRLSVEHGAEDVLGVIVSALKDKVDPPS